MTLTEGSIVSKDFVKFDSNKQVKILKDRANEFILTINDLQNSNNTFITFLRDFNYVFYKYSLCKVEYTLYEFAYIQVYLDI